MRVSAWAAFGIAGAWMVYETSHFLLNAREMALVYPDQVSVAGNHYVSRESIFDIFGADRNRSVLHIPLSERRRQLEALPWVEQATVRRALPNTIEVEIVEITPIAFLREGSDMALVDVHGVILDRPLEGNFHFPVVTGIGADTPAGDREKRMQLFAGFTQQVASSRAGALEQVSQVDLSDEHDLRATLSGLQGIDVSATPEGASEGLGQVDAPILVHFGDTDFEGKYQTLIENIGQWRAATGRVESIDLRFGREAIVNPDATVVAQHVTPPRRPAKH